MAPQDMSGIRVWHTMARTSLLLLRIRKLMAVLVRPRLLLALMRTGVLAGSEHRSILDRPWKTIVDIGANRGQFTLAAIEWSRARIIAFEPLQEAATVFRRAVGMESRVLLHVSAIGPDAEQRLMHVSGRDDSSSLLGISAEQSRLFPGTEEVAQEIVKVRPLDALIGENEVESPALLKLDVQGFEYEALLGCLGRLHAFQSIYCECSFIELYTGQKLASDVISLLEDHGFNVSGIHNPAYDDSGRCLQADFLFERVALVDERRFPTETTSPGSCES
ncbi:MAG: FkbM family methyltransferase [Betaproteobacteria bacterium]|nr:FkbM family methyltransferase [Betaproteobacteria bacterium]